MNAVFDPISQAYLEYHQIIKTDTADIWKKAFFKEIKRLTEDTNTIKFIKRTGIPANKKAIYVKINCDFRPQKEDPYRVRITVGGNLVFYTGETATPAANITTIKTL